MPIRRFSPLALVLTALLAACGGDKPEAAPAGQAAEPAPVADTAAASHGSMHGTGAPATVEDIDRWEKGMAAELDAVTAAAERMKAARSGEDSMAAMMAVQESATLEAGAKAAGVDLERYRSLRSNLSAAASYMTPELGGIDTAMLSPEQRDELRRLNEAQLERIQESVPEPVAEALRPRASALRRQELELVAARLKGVGR